MNDRWEQKKNDKWRSETTAVVYNDVVVKDNIDRKGRISLVDEYFESIVRKDMFVSLAPATHTHTHTLS